MVLCPTETNRRIALFPSLKADVVWRVNVFSMSIVQRQKMVSALFWL